MFIVGVIITLAVLAGIAFLIWRNRKNPLVDKGVQAVEKKINK